MLYLPITKNWIVSPTARSVYLVCALLSFALFGALFAISAAMAFSGVRSLAPFPVVLHIAKALLLPGIVGTATLTVAMWYFWFSFDNSSWVRKTFWFLPLYLLPPIGPPLYYFFVYRRSGQVIKIKPVTADERAL